MKKRYYYSIGFILFLVLFFASPYILDTWQWNSALNAVSVIPVYEGILGHNTMPCYVNSSGTCVGQTTWCTLMAPGVCATYSDMIVALSAGGQPCPNGYLLNPTQAPIVTGSSNIILGGTTCNVLSVVASERGCVGCTAKINSPIIYAYKNSVKSFINNYIIAIFKD